MGGVESVANCPNSHGHTPRLFGLTSWDEGLKICGTSQKCHYDCDQNKTFTWWKSSCDPKGSLVKHNTPGANNLAPVVAGYVIRHNQISTQYNIGSIRGESRYVKDGNISCKDHLRSIYTRGDLAID